MPCQLRGEVEAGPCALRSAGKRIRSFVWKVGMAFRNGAKRLVLASGCPFAYSFNLGCGGEHKIAGEVQAALQLAASCLAFPLSRFLPGAAGWALVC